MIRNAAIRKKLPLKGAHLEELVAIEEKIELDSLWQLIVYNDDINTMDFVVDVFKQVFGFSHELAYRLMLEIHTQGEAVLWVGDKNEGESYAHQLKVYGLVVSLKPI